MNINKEWHLKNKMPKNPTFDQRVMWHYEHSKNCGCRKDIPKDIVEAFKEKGLN